MGEEPKVLEELVRWVVEATSLPVIAKLSPNVTDIREPAEAARRGGAHAVSLINTIKSIIGVDLDNLVLLPSVGKASSNGGYCGPAVKPIALRLLGELARDPNMRIPISGIGGISDWRDAAEFLALGATNVQVCTAVMHYGYRIVEDMIEGLEEFLRSKSMKSVRELVGVAVPGFVEWGDLDLNHHVVAKIDADKCIGCNLCHVACWDGAHQCIHLPGQEAIPGNVAPMAAEAKRRLEESRAAVAAGTPGAELYHVPWVDETECVGCNLCSFVCPVEHCITMVEQRRDPAPDTWHDRMATGRDKVPGGLADL